VLLSSGPDRCLKSLEQTMVNVELGALPQRAQSQGRQQEIRLESAG
jgi:hypothetical protein